MAVDEGGGVGEAAPETRPQLVMSVIRQEAVLAGMGLNRKGESATMVSVAGALFGCIRLAVDEAVAQVAETGEMLVGDGWSLSDFVDLLRGLDPHDV